MADPEDFSPEELRYLDLLRAFVHFLLRFERDSLIYVQQMQEEGSLDEHAAGLLRYHLNQALRIQRRP